MQKRVTNKHYDITGMESHRLVRQLVLWKAMRLHNIVGKPRLLDLVELWLRQYVGEWISIITVKYEGQWRQALQLFRRYRFHVTRTINRVLRRPPGSTKAS